MATFNTRIAKHLFSDYRINAAEGFRWMLDQILDDIYQANGQEWVHKITIPEYGMTTVESLKEIYFEEVRRHPWEDILGKAYMEIASNGHKSALGQFFTPHSVATMMAQMTWQAPPEDQKFIRVCDPACGSAMMLLAFMEIALHHSNKVNWLERTMITGVDLDPVCSRMAAIQITANLAQQGLSVAEILIIQGNSLFPEKTWNPYFHASRPQLDVPPAQHHQRKKMVKEAYASQQMDLFDTIPA